MSRYRICAGLLVAVAFASPDAVAATVSGQLQKWETVTVDFTGPAHDESDSGPNPFLDYRLQVLFTAPGGAKTYSVPGFFDGDGAGGGNGSVWRVRFTPDETGTWTYQASFRSGTQLAVDLDPSAGTPTSFDGDSGTFTVADVDAAARGFYRDGRLESVGEYYLKFRDGGYWLKLGTNNPENLLGYDGFDNTPFAWHSYANHDVDWQPGDPDWDSPDLPGTNDGRGIIGALNYLNAMSLNSIYFMPMNIGADGKDTWPFSDPSINRDGSTSNDNLHYDISKLAQWLVVLEHAQRKDLFLHFVFNDKTRPNREELDLATLGVERKLFYREMLARFGHFNALQWNVSEEYNLGLPWPPDTIVEFANYIEATDPYGHPITVHPHGNTYTSALAPFFDDAWFGIMSVQTWQRPDDIGGAIEYLRNEAALAGNVVPVMLDESIGMNQLSANEYRKRTFWDALFSGGGFEMFKSFGDSEVDDFRVYEEYFRYAGYARSFVEENLPFWEMVPSDTLVTGEDTVHGGAEVFAKAGEVYAVYLPSASPGPLLTMAGSGETFEKRWYNPRSGGFEGGVESFVDSGSVLLGTPPADAGEDWVVLIRRQTPDNSPPVAPDRQVGTGVGTPVVVTLDFQDADGPGPYTREVTSAPASGSLSAINPDGTVTYSPNPGFSGIDRFSWRV
ncbi:MAG: DUF5060 domain-containing protein, partial [Proteobacteria bacterium]|nr:DUF5060 domain-containing protein [Pseudomonadota bacterium]